MKNHAYEKTYDKCNMIQWGKLHIRDGVPCCPRCGAEAEQIISFFGTPGWGHKINKIKRKATPPERGMG